MATAMAGAIAMIDPVVRAAMLPGELADLMERIDPDSDEVVHSTASAGGHDLGVLSAFNMRECDGVRFLGANGLYLAPGLSYASATTTRFNVGKPIDILTQACLKVSGRQFPHVVMAALAGRHISALVEHPALADARLIMGTAVHDRYVVLKSRTGPKTPAGDPTDNTFNVLLPQLLEDIGTEAVPS